MATTLNKIVFEILNIAASGPVSDDFRMSRNPIAQFVHECRSTLISQAIQKRQDLSDVWIQRIKKVNLSKVDTAEYTTIDTGCDILRTTVKIPRTIEVDNNNLIISVTGLDGEPISKLNYFRSRHKSYAKFTGKNRGWFLRGDYIYVVQEKDLKYISINGIFEDPSELGSFISTT